MRSSHASHARSPNFGMRQLLRCGRLALVLGWFGLWLGTIAHADCAVRLAPARSSGTIVQTGAIDHAPAPQYPDLESDDPDCQQLLVASVAPQTAVALPSCDAKSAGFALPPAAPPLVARPVDQLARADLFHPLPPGRGLYLRTSRLLI